MSYQTSGFRMPPLTTAIKHLIIANACVFVLNMLLLGRLSTPTADGGGLWFALTWGGLWEGYGLGLLRFVTCDFTHSYSDPMHFIMNMLGFYFFGTMVERTLGYRGVWKLAILSGMTGSVLQLLVQWVEGSPDIPSVGASGMVYGFIAYAAVIAPRATVILMIFPVQLWILAVGLVGIGLYSMFLELTGNYGSGVAHGAHVGGALFGAACAKWRWFISYDSYSDGGSKFGWFERIMQGFKQKRAQRDYETAQAQQLRMDEILAKVKAQGLASLTPAERKFLERASKHAQK
ncbi:MAG: membrane associated rhomboid family serine protease [Planctomycetota bacterium]|jgi:membrane associated rhomboid family serine protease